MRAVGSNVKIEDGRYLAGVAVIESGLVVAEVTFPAPADRDEAGQLSELYEWVASVVAEHRPDEFALRIAEFQTIGLRTDLVRHAEGVLLAGARHGGASRVSQWSRQKLIKPLGAAGKNAEDVRDAVRAHLDREPRPGVLTEAACAAVAAGAGAK
jgi:hypothetical protein